MPTLKTIFLPRTTVLYVNLKHVQMGESIKGQKLVNVLEDETVDCSATGIKVQKKQ